MSDAADKESLIAKKTANAIFSVADSITKSGPFLDALASIEGYILPPPAAVLFLLHGLAGMLGYTEDASKDVCGDISWTAIRTKILNTYVNKIADYDVTVESETMSDEALKAFIETNAITPDVLTTFPFLPLLLSWIQKAISSRDADKAYEASAEEARLAAEAAAEAAAAAEAGGEEE